MDNDTEEEVEDITVITSDIMVVSSALAFPTTLRTEEVIMKQELPVSSLKQTSKKRLIRKIDCG